MIEKTCVRCSKLIAGQEKYWLLSRYYCRACKEFIEQDRDHPYNYMMKFLDRFEQVEV